MPSFELYLVRHAIAAERGAEWPDDTKRPLTVRGMARFKDAVRGLHRLDVVIDEIFTSPLMRARQTADLLAAGLASTPVVKTLEALAPDHAPAAVLTALARAARRSRIALVGHEPGLGELAGHLVGTRRAIPFRKGGVARIDLGSISARRIGTLIWLLPPKVLRELGGR